MKISNTDNYVHVLDSLTNTWTVLRNIANSNDQEDAFYVCNISDIVQKFETWKAVLPRVEPFYAVKCNDSLTVLEVLAALGTGFDCASKNEINQVLSMGLSPDRILFGNPAKPASQIKHAANTDVSLVAFDSAAELHKLKRLHPQAELVIRIRSEVDDTDCPIKLGCDPVSEAPELLEIANSLELKVVGVSFHIESGCKERQVYTRTIEAARDLFNYASRLGYNMNLLDLGGGFPGDRRGPSINEIADEINNALDLYFPEPSVRIIASPSRFFVSSAYTLACNIHSIRSVDKVDPVSADYYPHRMYFINDGIYGSFNSILYDDRYFEPLPLNEHPMSKMSSSSVWGPTCDGLDQVVDEIVLPEMNIGDWIVFENMGAYTLPVASAFNGFPIPQVHIVAKESTWNLLKDILPLTEDHFIMGNLPESIRVMHNKNPSEKLSLPVIPSRLPISDAIPFENNQIFQFGYFEQPE